MSTDAKEVVVIGPGSIGRAIARRVGSGRILLLAAHSEKATQDAAEQLLGGGFEVAQQTTDISDRDAVEALADKAAAMGPVTRVIHAAGVSPTQASIERVLEVDLVGGGEPLGRAHGAHVLEPLLARAGELIQCQRGDDHAGADGVDAGTPLAPRRRGGKYAQRVGPLRERVGVDGGPDPLGLEERQREQLRGRCRRERAAAFLLGERAGFITGADLLMDGGVTAALRVGELTMSS